MNEMGRPMCVKCEKPFSPSGGTVGDKEHDRIISWTCFTCNIIVQDIGHTIITKER